MTKVCRKCKEAKPLTVEYFNKSKQNKDGFKGECRVCFREYMSKYYSINKEKLLMQNKEYQRNNKASSNEKKTKWAKKNKDKVRKAQKDYHSKNPYKKAQWEAKRRSKKLESTPNWAELEKIEVLYQKAKWLSKLTGLVYHVDHIVPLQGENVCGLHCWNNLQILESSINFSKGNKYED